MGKTSIITEVSSTNAHLMCAPTNKKKLSVYPVDIVVTSSSFFRRNLIAHTKSQPQLSLASNDGLHSPPSPLFTYAS